MSDLPPINQKIEMDATSFKAGIAAINREMRVIESGFLASAASLGDWGKSADGLEARIKSLGQKMDLQKSKVDGLKSVYQQLAAAGNTSKKELDELQIRINKETETLGKMESELKQSTSALDQMGNEANQAGNETKELGDKSGQAASKLETLKKVAAGMGAALKIGAKAVAGMALAAAAAGAAIAGLVLKAADMAGELVDTANVTGIGVERLQELAFVGDQLGVSTETMTGSLAKLTRAMSSARDGTGDQALAFKTLGVAITNNDGSLRDSEAVWQDSLKALGGVANETERDALAMALFGKSALELNPLIKTSAEEIETMTKKAHEMGAVMSKENVNALESFGDTLAGLKRGLQGTLGTLAAAFLPAFQGIAGAAEKYMGQFSTIISGANGDLGKMADGIGGLLGQIANDLAAQGPKMLTAGLGIIQGIVNAIIANLPTLLPAAISMITTLVQFIVQNLPTLITAGVQVITALVQGILPMLPLLIEAALQMVITLATGIAQALPTLIPAIVAIIPQIVQVLINNLPALITAALAIIMALVQGLIAALPVLIEAIPQLITAIVTTLIETRPLIITAALEIILALVLGLVQNIPLIVLAVFQIIDGIIQTFKNTDWAQIGTDIMQGIRNGWDAAWAKFVAYISGAVADMVDWVKKTLGIASPSKVFAGIGENMALGLGAGFSSAFGGIERQVANAVGGLGNMNLGTVSVGGGPQAGIPGGGAQISVTVQVGNVTSDIDWHWAARKVAEEIRRLA